jgi:serine/threonine protein kinase
MTETEKFEHFQVLRREDGSLWELGRGAMGVTYKAFDTNLRCDVALKVISPQYLNSETARQRFLREARAAAQLRHPNVATVFHLGSVGDCYFYAMEFVLGETLERRIQREGPLPLGLALRIARQVTRALVAADRQRLVHRDIKPSNIMLVRDDSEDHVMVKVIDFGLAKAATGSSDSMTVTLGGFVGTPHFASPEQLEEREIDTRSDIYSLGVTIWYMLMGRPPFHGSMASVIHQQLGSPPPVNQLTGLPAAVIEMLQRCLAKDPADRFAGPGELKLCLDQLLSGLRGETVTLAPGFSVGAGETGIGASAQGFATGQLVGNRYEILGQAPGDDQLFQARDKQSRRVVAFRSDVPAAEAAIQRLRSVHHPNVLQVYDLERTDRGTFLVSEWLRGFSFRDLLRARRSLAWPEVAPLLRPLARAVDFLADRQLLEQELGIQNVYVESLQTREELDRFWQLPVTHWPAFSVKVDPIGLAPPGESGASESVVRTRRSGALSPVRVLAQICYELLGGVMDLPRIPGKARFRPLTALSEQCNKILSAGLTDPGGFRSASEFVAALEEAQPADVFGPAPPPLPIAVRDGGTGTSSGEFSTGTESGQLQPKASPILLRVFIAAVTVLFLVAVGGVVYTNFFVRRPEPVQASVGEGYLTLDTKPTGASVQVDGKEIGRTPLNNLKLSIGKKTLEISYPGYQTRSVETQINTGSIDNLGVVPLLRSVGRIAVSTNPAGVPFEIVGPEQEISSGVSPLQLDELPVGQYQITLKRPGWPDVVQTVDLTVNSTATIQQTYQGAPVTLKSDPSGATIYLNGRELGKTPLTINLPFGTNELTSKIGALGPVTQNVTPDPNGPTVVEFHHVYGYLAVICNRSDASVTIAGASVGPPPIEGILPPGRHQVIVRVSGQPDQTQTAEVQANRRTVTKFTFNAQTSDTPNAATRNASASDSAGSGKR